MANGSPHVPVRSPHSTTGDVAERRVLCAYRTLHDSQREHRRISRALKTTKVKASNARLEDIDISANREPDKRQMMDVLRLLMDQARHNIWRSTGPPGPVKPNWAAH